MIFSEYWLKNFIVIVTVVSFLNINFPSVGGIGIILVYKTYNISES